MVEVMPTGRADRDELRRFTDRVGREDDSDAGGKCLGYHTALVVLNAKEMA